MKQTLRLIDANQNRAREAMRVMEDAARFLINDKVLSQAFKAYRHDYATTLSECEALKGMLVARDTTVDVGTTNTTDAEYHRPTETAVIIAAGKRLSEALRAIEEYGKTLDPVFAKRIETLRYRGYTLEKELIQKLSPNVLRQWRLCVLITESLCKHHDWFDVARATLDGGADCLQLREKDMEGGAFIERGARLVELAQQYETEAMKPAVIINDRIDVALLCGADGVHLGQGDIPIPAARKLIDRPMIMGLSTTNLEQARAAHELNVDYCGVGPMFPTTTKHKPTLAGPTYLKQYLELDNPAPHLAIGGITPENLPNLISVGCQGIAVSSVICGHEKPGEIVRTMLNAYSTH